jgi:death-on-curing protein
MSAPIFLTLSEVIELHRISIEEFGGTVEIRDMGLLQSATAMPHAQFGGSYLHPDLAAMAAAYLYHIVMNHPFVDGNKRTGAIAARTFLLMNDVAFAPGEEELYELVMSVARGEANKDRASEFFRAHANNPR